MSIPASERLREEERLHSVLTEIAKQLGGRKLDTSKYREQLIDTQDFLREEKPRAIYDFDDVVEVSSGMEKLKAAAKLHRFSADRVKQLERLAVSPYFARIDFRLADHQVASMTMPVTILESAGRPANTSALGEIADAGVQRIYIGISSLIEDKTGTHLVLDWRAPISSMYYDFEVGPAEYQAPLGIVKGEMLLKRHFRIKNGNLLSMFDNSLTIYDEMLQEALSSATGDRMRTIVNTIQREQNRVIRGEVRGALVVQGSAGSGKTVIALHRAAYLLYKHRNTMSAKNILMFSPGGVFTDYTSPVLPELGEEPVDQTSFGEFASQRLRAAMAPPDPYGSEDAHGTQLSGATSTPAHESSGSSGGPPSSSISPAQVHLSGLRIESSADQMEYLLETRGSKGYEIRAAGIRLKSSPKFTLMLEKYAHDLTEDAEGLDDVTFRDAMVMSRTEAAQLLFSEYRYLPLEKRVDKIKRRVNWLLDEVVEDRYEQIRKELAESEDSAYLFAKDIKRMARQQAHQEVQRVRDRVAAWKPVATIESYLHLFRQGILPVSRLPGIAEACGISSTELVKVCRETVSRIQSDTVPYEDLAPLLLLHSLLNGFPDSGGIRHIIVDEVQDYSPLQHEVLRRSFPGASFTLLGDVNQSMNQDSGPRTSSELTLQVTEVYGASGEQVVPVVLTESYRSTKEITEFTRGILAGGEPIVAIERPGELPVVWCSTTREELGKSVAKDVSELVKSGLGSVAVITKTARESWTALGALKTAPELEDHQIHLVKPGESRFRRGILVIPSYLAKGLEFEAVVIFDASQNRYSHEADRRVLYTACSRALHKLRLHYAGKMSPFVAEVDRQLWSAYPD